MNQHIIDQIAHQWYMRSREGLSTQEQKAFEAWLETTEHKKAYEATQRLIESCLDVEDTFIKELEEDILNDDMAEPSKAFYQKRSFFASVVAACLVLFVGVALKEYYFEPIFEQHYATSDQKLLNIALPDTTTVDLDIKSTIDIAYYNHKRTVAFTTGKALFSVAKDAYKPFVIKVGDTVIEVVGTKFEVLHVNDLTTVSVLEGIVKVSDKMQSAFYQLKQADSITFNEAGKVLNYGQINTQKIADWKEDALFFEKTTLKDAAAQFAYYTNQKMTFESDELSLLKLSGKFSTTHFHGFVEAMETIYGLKAKKENEGIRIVRK
jgi:transmembrane sensor